MTRLGAEIGFFSVLHTGIVEIGGPEQYKPQRRAGSRHKCAGGEP